MTREEVLTKLKQHRSELFERYGIVSLGLFGSVARDQAGTDSDVDLVVRLMKPDLFTLTSLREELKEILGAEIDLVHEHARIRPLLAQRIHRDFVNV